MSGDASKKGGRALRALGAALIVAFAAWRVWTAMQAEPGVSEKAWFYDESALRLFVAPRGLIPPIAGIDGPGADGVRAVVVAPPGRCDDAAARRIAYLETTTPELKQVLEAAKAAGRPPEVSRGAAQAQRLVRRPEDAGWVSLVSPEGEAIVSGWATPGPDGVTPAVCSP